MDDKTLIELEALKVEAVGMLADNVGRLVGSGSSQPYGYKQVSDIAESIRALAKLEEKSAMTSRPDPLPLLKQAYQAMNVRTQCYLRDHGCHESAAKLRSAADAIAAAYPEVTK